MPGSGVPNMNLHPASVVDFMKVTDLCRRILRPTPLFKDFRTWGMKSLHILSAKSDDLGEFYLRIVHVPELLTLALKSCFEDGDGSFETDHWWWEGALWAEARWGGILA